MEQTLNLDAAARLGEIRASSEERDVFRREIQLLCRNATGRQKSNPHTPTRVVSYKAAATQRRRAFRASDICITLLWTLKKIIEVARHGF